MLTYAIYGQVCCGMEELKWSVEKPANFEAVVTD
jgi:hypothetical protein